MTKVMNTNDFSRGFQGSFWATVVKIGYPKSIDNLLIPNHAKRYRGGFLGMPCFAIDMSINPAQTCLYSCA